MRSEDNRVGYLQIIMAMIIWGSVGIVARFIPYSSKIIVFYRVLFAFISLTVYIFATGNFKMNLEGKKLFTLGAGFFLALNWLFFFRAVKTTTIANATISYYTSPIILNILAVIVLKEKLLKKTIISLIIAFTGLLFIISNGSQTALVNNKLGIIYGLTAAFFYALFAITNKKITGLSSLKTTFIQSGVAVLSFIPFVVPITIPNLKSLLLLLIMGVFHTALALILYVSGLKKIKAQSVGVLSYLDPVSAVILAALFLGEIPSILTLIGAVLILGSGYILMKK